MSGKIRFLPPRGASERERDFAINSLIKMVGDLADGFAGYDYGLVTGVASSYDDYGAIT